jgi:hypothetical protein
VTSSSAVILLYWWLLPTILYLLVRWRQSNADFTYLEMLCIYGYSLSIYIPVSIIWIIKVPMLQWIVVLIALALSGGVLVFTFWPAFSHDKINVSRLLFIGIILFE